ncbi:hypothetical protein [Brevundimonas sp. NPDC046655]|uniref:hypothetical protein n=1 Tax=unclassified Brevundimonas TaxID=2622653 RepID=UPI00384C3CDA
MNEFERGLPGYESIELPQAEGHEGTEGWTAEQWQAEFIRTQDQLVRMMVIRDPYIMIARSAVRLLSEMGKPEELHPKLAPLEQPFVEFLQALLLINDQPTRAVPTSPGNFERLWRLIARNYGGFTKRRIDRSDESAAQRAAIRQAQLQTLHYRNLFNRDDCERTMAELLARIDKQSNAALGYMLSDFYRAAVRLSDLTIERFDAYHSQIRALLTTNSRDEILACIRFACERSPVVARAWRDRADLFPDLEDLRSAGLQVMELGFPWAFTLPKKTIEAEFPSEMVDVFYKLSIRPGELAGRLIDHVYLDNPIWRKPYVRLPDDDLFIPLPQLIYSFPFAIVEGLIGENAALKIAYEDARAGYLEDTTEALVRTGLPSATVHRSVVWNDPEDGKEWENDVVALVGNFIFVFEAKSGRINPVARRGGIKSLTTNFEELFIEPGRQAGRLQRYLNTKGSEGRLRLKSTGQPIDLNMDKPKVVFSFSVCIEHFAALTSAKTYLKNLDLVTDDLMWSPVLSLGELYMIVKFLDSEVSLVHYLTRRSTLEQVIDFHGDEQDLLSAYLANGLWIDGDALEGQKVVFFKSDAAVRKQKNSRADRTFVELHGVPLSPLWQEIVEEVYRDHGQRHRFDIINTILNQNPSALREIEKRVRRYRRGMPHKGEDTFVVKYPVGRKTFTVAVHLEPRLTDPEEFQSFGRNLTLELLEEDGGVECATFLFVRKPGVRTFIAGSFYRYLTRASIAGSPI